jgi:hypothetical protein
MSLARIPFTSEDEGVIRSLVNWMLFVTIAVNFIACGIGLILSCIGGIGVAGMFSISATRGVFTLLSVVFLFLMCATYIGQGVVMVQARGSLQAVATTDDADQAHLSVAFRKLRVVFLIEVVFAVLSLLMQVVQLIASFVVDGPIGGMPGGNLGGSGFGGGM